jgi:hypothetical protein
MEALIEATTWGVFVPFALSVGYLGGIGTANLLHRTDRRRPRYLTRYVAHVEQQLARHRIPDLPPISTIPRPAFDNSRRPVLTTYSEARIADRSIEAANAPPPLATSTATKRRSI